MSAPPDDDALCFGTMALHPGSRLLLDAGVPVRLGGRAFDLLVVLAERAGEVVTKDELVSRVWRQTIVEETSLRVHVAALRRALGDGRHGVRFIVNVPGRGYAFVAPVTARKGGADRPGPSPVCARPPTRRLPARLARMLGRERDVARLAEMLASHRLVTVTGTGGIGKTTLALAVAEQALASHADGAAFVDLSALADGERVASTLCCALGLSAQGGACMDALASHLRDKALLLVLDNCEHVIDKASQVAVDLLRLAPGLRILATSREALRAQGERVHRLTPLACPPAQARLDVEQAMAYPAMQLLVERVEASASGYVLAPQEVDLAGELCRRLDGIPLAIELAAARVGFVGLRELVQRLDARLQLLTSGYRTARPRHQTLRALHDWSYRLLEAPAQEILRNLSVFAGTFTLDDAIAVAAPPGADRLGTEALVADLAAKSLLSTDHAADAMRYRLLETTRSYAAEQLQAAGTGSAPRRRHARWLLGQLQRANPLWTYDTRAPWLARYGRCIDDVRAALDWACAEPGEEMLAAELTRSALQLAQQLSLLEEFQGRLERALALLEGAGGPRPLLEMALNSQLSITLGQGHRPDGTRHPARRAALAAQRASDGRHHGEVPYAQWVTEFGRADYAAALVSAQALQDGSRAAGDADGLLVSQRMLAQTWHFLGDQGRARHYVQQVLAQSSRPLRIGGTLLDPLDRRVSMRIVRSRIQWIEGFPLQAMCTALEAMDLAQADMGYAQCQVLGLALCPIAIWSGDVQHARQYVARLKHLSGAHSLGYWQDWGEALERVLCASLDPRTFRAGPKLHDLLGTMVPRVVDEALLARSQNALVGWCTPEHWRAHGENLATARAAEPRRAADALSKALAAAKAQGALAWELRAAMSLVRLQQRLGLRQDGRQALKAAYERFTEGHDTHDLQAAGQLLDAAEHRGR